MPNLPRSLERRTVLRGGWILILPPLLLLFFATTRPLAAQPAGASLQGRVVSAATGEPLPGVRLSLAGTDASALTDSAGSFLLQALPGGVQFLEVAFLGPLSERFRIRLLPRRRTEVRVLLDWQAFPLPTLRVSVEGERRGKLAGFYDRLETEHGVFFTREQIAELRPTETTDLLRRVPGLQVSRLPPSRQEVSRVRGRTCNIRFFLDGMHVPGFDVDAVPPEDIDGIEIYRGSSEVPPIFRRFTTCAAIAIWTREPGT
ncbi:MAG: TonB-dependent receptor plug domain-containing protein [Gemmatimonadota bacterium]